jgi:cell surface protein SprA
MLTDVARIFLSGIILFYAAINLGFLAPYQSQINQGMWVDVFFKNLEQQNLIEQQKLLGQKDPYDNPVKSVQVPDSSKKQLTIPIGLPSDSTNKINVPSTHTSTLKDTSHIKDTSKVIKDVEMRNTLPTLLFKTLADTSRNKNNILPKSLRSKDTLAAMRDTAKIDSMAIDSTARLKYMKYAREDAPNVQLNLPDKSDFFAKPSDAVAKRVIVIDSTGEYVVIKDVVGNEDRKIILRMPLEDYINLQLALNETDGWGDNFNSLYQFKSSKKELAELMKDITTFEIPLPSVGVLSIFGKPIIKLTIGGAVDIHGAWRNETTEGVTTSALGNTKNEPSFQQQVQINVNGTIGDKLTISADWNTERTFEYQNMLHIKYTGYEDEIIQSIEAGNVSMQASPLVGGSEALFGIKAQFKLGPLALTTLASQKKGEIKEIAVSSGTQSAPFNIRAYGYATNNFFVDTVYARSDNEDNIFNEYYGGSVQTVNHPELKIIQLQVWKTKNTVTYDASKERKANAWITLGSVKPNSKYTVDSLRSDNINPQPGIAETGRFVLLTEGTDYSFEPNTGYITLLTTVNDADAVAVSYTDNSGTRQFGEFLGASVDTSQRLVLKLIKPANLKPQYTTAWKLMLKNIYSVGATNIQKDGFELQIKYEIAGQDPVTTYSENGTQVQLLKAFGMDKYDASGGANSDNIFDWRPTITVLPVAGEIIFPSLQPFSAAYLKANGLTDSALAFQAVYDTSATYAAQDQTHDKWIISGKYSGDVTSVHQLGFNVVENSVKVILNGKQLTANVDYSVDYNTGQLTILNGNALIPGADLKITFEQNDLFTLASKTLLGARGIVNISDKTKFGFSILNLNEQTLSDKVRIGEEPLSNTMMGVDFNTSADLPFMTNLLDKVISTKQMSSFTLAGEFAHMSPNPNTMKSTIPDDGGQSIAYIDDFEGSKKIIPIGVGYTSWKDLSAPDSLAKLTPNQFYNYISNSSESYYKNLMRYKGKSWWYSVTPSDVNVNQIWGSKKQVATSDQQVSVLDYVYLPDTPGTYNMNPNLGNAKQNWGGMMKVLSSTANDLQAQNMQYIEFWLNVQAAPDDSAKIYIDLGRISEDVIPDKVLNTEDKNNNGVIDQGEDIGLDGMTDAQEIDAAKSAGYYTAIKGDPNNDDFNLNNVSGNRDENAYFNVNGTENNGVLTDIGRIPDTEDLNLNGNLDVVNSYFRYQVPLDTNAAKKLNLIPSEANTTYGWHLYRIPLQNHIDSIGSPSLSDIEYIRVFATGVDKGKKIHVRFAEFNLVGNQWQQAIPYDPVMAVSVINYEDNQDYYSPPGITREQDRTQTTATVYKNEQAMDLIVKNLPNGAKREAVEYLSRSLDIFSYKAMKVFFHGDETPGTNIAGAGGKTTAQVYIRFGSDTLNFYEYRQPIQPNWNDVNILFKELTTIKEERDSVSTTNTYYVPVNGYTDRYYGIRGNPSLTAIKFLTIGVISDTNNAAGTTLNGEVWVNELRVVGADDHAGNAYTMSTSLKLADLLNLSFNMSHTDAWFHSLSDRFGSRNDSKNWSFGADLDVLKLLPFNMPGSSLNLSYNHTENVQKPQYVPGTDISIEDAASKVSAHAADSIRTSAQTISTSDSWSLGTIALKIPSNYWLIRDTFNALAFSFNYNKTFARSPTVLSSNSWLWNAGMNYNVSLSQDNYLLPVRTPIFGPILGLLGDYRDVKVYFLPQSFAFSLTAKRNRSFSTSRATTTAPSTTIFSHDFTTARGFNFSWKITEGGLINLATDYSANFNSSLAYLEASDDGTQLLSESKIWRQIFSGSMFGRDYSFSQNINVRTSPKLPTIWDIDKNFNLTASYSVGYQWTHNFSATTTDATGKTIDAGKGASFQNKSQVTLRVSLKALMDPFFANAEESQQLLNNMPGNNMRGGPGPGNPPEGNPPGANPEGRQRNFGQEPINKNADGESKSGQKLSNLTKEKVSAQDTTAKLDSLSLAKRGKEFVQDTTAKLDSLSLAKKGKKFQIKNAVLVIRTVAKILLFDYETININFNNSNSISKAALLSNGSGFNNLWGFTFKESNGPSKLYMLGLNSDVGSRVLGLSSMTDVFSESNNIDIQTSRPLWEGAKIDLTWKIAWTLNKSTPFTTKDNFLESAGPITATGTLSRSFFSLPPVFALKVFKSGISQVNKLYDPNAADPQASLSNAFVEGFETLPLLQNAGFLQNFASYIPRPNWSISWDGLEKYFPFKSIAEKVSLDHSYSASYTEGWYLDSDGKKVTQTQQINYAFTPLVGLNMTFGKLWKGNLSGSIKYATSSSFSLGLSTSNITQAATKDIGLSATYSKSGFEIPLFGLSLKNDIEFTFSYTFSQTSTILFDMSSPDKFSDSGTPQDGQTRVTIEPRVKYTISSKVSLSIFYTRTTVQPEGASRVEPTTSNEAGLDVHIAIGG